jgi:hypothetical protein
MLEASLRAAGSAAVFDALINDLYCYRLGVQDRLDALLREFPEFVLAHLAGLPICKCGDWSVNRALNDPRPSAPPRM